MLRPLFTMEGHAVSRMAPNLHMQIGKQTLEYVFRFNLLEDDSYCRLIFLQSQAKHIMMVL